ncbi:MAG: bifunctional (p)ppGpp synthetase/guanosine-3',5'-bis(diphosphate) 3'-pyrophosphohydrolase [Bacilli bacterium]|nr:bifunctional (p)ppGpp synthetase/guanosine-3',5'-bis(diphosphate) 3'-pyrophosphohydrolase [Bacilli bacterium]
MYCHVTIENVLAEAEKYLRQEKNIKLIKEAYDFAQFKHQGQFRMSNDPYIQHPLEIAFMLASLKTGPATIVAGILHDILEDTETTKEELELKFGSDIASIVDGVTKIGRLKYMTKAKVLAKNHQKILLAMAKDIRVVIVKLVDRIHNMRTLEFHTVENQKRIAQETLDLYAPLAHRIGMYRIKAELEDLSFKYLNYEKYKEISDFVLEQRSSREDDLNKMKERINVILNDNNIKNYELKGRVKNIYSVYKKMIQKNLFFEQIYDLVALRVIVNNIEECYQVLGLIHGEFSPLPGRFKDYIAMPKPNLYQSLHTTIVGLSGKMYEIQIRTKKMDEVAELGVAAHWAYKEESTFNLEKEQIEITNKLKWYRDLMTYIEMGEGEDDDPFENIREDIFSANVYVFTPKGDVFDFPTGATPLDFAYRIHTEIGNKTTGAIVNGKIVPLSYKLKTGDVIEIKTSKSFDGPNESWVKIVKTSHAKHKITSILNKKKKDELIIKGKEEFSTYAKLENFSLNKLDDKTVNDQFSKYNITNVDDFFFEIGKGVLSAKGALAKITGESEKLDESTLIKQYEEASAKRKKINEFGILVEGIDKAPIRLGNCCHPVKGDDIVGYITKGTGIVIHRLECSNVNNLDSERLIEVSWDSEFTKKNFETVIYISSYDRKNIVAEIINVTNSCTVNIVSISSSKNKEGDLLTKVKILVHDLEGVQNVISNLQKVPDIYSIERKIK